MAESKKITFTKAEFLTETKFAKKYGIPKELVSLAVRALYKQNKQAKTPSGNLTPVIVRNRNAYAGNSSYLIHPLFHDIVIAEVEKQKKLLEKKPKGLKNEV